MGRVTVIARLLVWALAIVAIDGVVIVTNDGSDASKAQTAQAASTTTTATTTSATATTGTTATTTVPTTATTSADQATSTTVAGGDNPATTVDTTPTTTASTNPGSACSVPPGPGEVAHVHCDGETASTVSFHVNGRWQVRWTVEPGLGVVGTVSNDADPDQDPYFVPMSAPSGEAGFVDGCDCTLELVPDGSAYDVVVVDVDG